MARHRFGGSTVRKLKLSKPSAKELKIIYAGIINYEATSRFEALTKAFQWYDEGITYVMATGNFSSSKTKLLDLAIKSRRLGVSNTSDAEKEAAFTFSIKKYEAVCNSLNPPKLSAWYEKLEAKRDILEKQAKKLTSRYASLLDVLTGCLNPLGLNGKPIEITVSDIEVNRRFHPELNKLIYSKETAEKLLTALNTDGLMPVIVAELSFMSRASSLQKDAEGNYTINLKRQLEAMDTMLKRLLQYLKESGSIKLLFVKRPLSNDPPPEPIPGLQDPITSTPAAQAISAPTQRVYKSRAGAKVGGQFSPNTAVSVIWNLLADQRLHYWDEIRAAVSAAGYTANIQARVNRIVRAGKKSLQWKVTVTKSSVQMLLK